MKNTCIIIVAVLCLFSFGAQAQAPAFIPVQAFLTDANDNPLEGQYTLHLKLFDDALAGQELFSEDQVVMAESGLVTIYLGQAETLDLALFKANSAVFFSLAIDNDAEMQPRLPLGTVPWAAFADNAGDAATLQGHPASDFRLAGSVNWSDLTNLPPDLENGDDDSFADITCMDGKILQTINGSWVCVDPPQGGVTSITQDLGIIVDVPVGDVTIGVDRNQFDGWYVPRDEPGSISSGMLANSYVQAGIGCQGGQVMIGIDANGSPVCTTLYLNCTVRSTNFNGASGIAGCNAGEFVTGGGFYITDGSGTFNWDGASSAPQGNGWACTREVYMPGSLCQCHAVCCTIQ